MSDEPRTEAGKRLLERIEVGRAVGYLSKYIVQPIVEMAVREIESEAASLGTPNLDVPAMPTLSRSERIEQAAQALVDSWYSGDEGPFYLALREALEGSDAANDATFPTREGSDRA